VLLYSTIKYLNLLQTKKKELIGINLNKFWYISFLNRNPNKELFKKFRYSFKLITGESTCFIDFHNSIVNQKQQIYYCEDDGVDTSIVRIDDNLFRLSEISFWFVVVNAIILLLLLIL
jgi:hypothetical protein